MKKVITGAAFFIGGTILINGSNLREIIGIFGIVFVLIGASFLINETLDARNN